MFVLARPPRIFRRIFGRQQNSVSGQKYAGNSEEPANPPRGLPRPQRQLSRLLGAHSKGVDRVFWLLASGRASGPASGLVWRPVWSSFRSGPASGPAGFRSGQLLVRPASSLAGFPSTWLPVQPALTTSLQHPFLGAWIAHAEA